MFKFMVSNKPEIYVQQYLEALGNDNFLMENNVEGIT